MGNCWVSRTVPIRRKKVTGVFKWRYLIPINCTLGEQFFRNFSFFFQWTSTELVDVSRAITRKHYCHRLQNFVNQTWYGSTNMCYCLIITYFEPNTLDKKYTCNNGQFKYYFYDLRVKASSFLLSLFLLLSFIWRGRHDPRLRTNV